MSLQLIRRHEPSSEGRRCGFLSLDGFTRYLDSAECRLADCEHDAVCQDMRQPLSHYYVSCSHRTYLTQDQLRGPAHLAGYVRALRLGVRCVEVDAWDGTDGEPVVCGHAPSPSLSSSAGAPPPLRLRDVLEVVARFAFEASDYPLIISLENHCSPPQQRALRRHLLDVLGEQLYTATEAAAAADADFLPSPHDLRKRILLMGRKLPPGWEGQEGQEEVEEDQEELLRSSCSNHHLHLHHKSHSRRVTLLKELSDLVTLCCSSPTQDCFSPSSSCSSPWETYSYPECLALRLAAERPGDFVNHNKRRLSRVRPSAVRLDSSNMNPLDVWKCGCQLVALNLQTAGLAADLHAAWFRQNGGCGYVLRPAIMRQQVSYFSADTRDSVPGVSPQLLHVKVRALLLLLLLLLMLLLLHLHLVLLLPDDQGH